MEEYAATGKKKKNKTQISSSFFIQSPVRGGQSVESPTCLSTKIFWSEISL